MRIIQHLILILFALQIAYGADMPLKRRKVSKDEEFDTKKEVAVFYLDLLAHNSTVKRQFDQIRQKTLDFDDPHSGTDDPQVVEWFPMRGAFDAGEGYSSEDSHFLVIQPLSFSRPRQHDYYMTVVSEFHVVHNSKWHDVPREQKAKTDFDEIEISFLGFRNFKISPSF
jgi:hypothetical protein